MNNRPLKQKAHCKNCGDETTFPANVDAGREIKGWCVPCYRTWMKQADGKWGGPNLGLDGKSYYDTRR